MYAHVKKPKEIKRRTVVNSVAQKKSASKQGLVFLDNRPQVEMLSDQRNYRNHVPIQRQVEVINEKRDSNGIAGDFEYSFQWRATEKHANGYIVQQITRKERIETEKDIPNTFDVTENVVTYWEAWEVKEGEVFNQGVPIKGVHDTWAGPKMPKGTKGVVTMIANRYFSDNGKIVANMRLAGVPQAGGLLSSEDKPDLTGAEFIGEHKDAFWWDRTTYDDY